MEYVQYVKIKNLQKHGNSKCVLISADELRFLGIKDKVKFIMEKNKIIIERVEENDKQL